MCLICGQEVQFFAGVPTGGAHPGALAFDVAANYSLFVYNGGWQAAGSAFTGGFSPGGGVIPADYQAVKFFNGVPTGGAPQGTLAFDTSSLPYTLYVFSGGWQEVGVSSTTAADLLGVCGPNVLFGPSSPPPCPKNPPGVGTVFFPTNGDAPYVFYPPGGGPNCGWQPIGIGGVAPVVKTVIYDTQALSSIMIPADWNNADNKIECLGCGGGGGDGDAAYHGGGGGGGASYAFANNVAMPAGMAVACFIGQEFGVTNTFIENAVSTIVCEAGGGGNGGAGPGGAPGAAGVWLVGDGGNNGGTGGTGGTGAGGAGGGGAGGPLGPGAAGGSTNGSFSAASGGGANNGSAGQSGIATTGGQGAPGGAVGSTGGAGCAVNTAPTLANDGTLGGSGGGSGGPTAGVVIIFPGGSSSIDLTFGPSNGCGAGGCGGGGGPFGNVAQAGIDGGAGHGNSGGGGGGGGGSSNTGGGTGAAGTGGLIKLTWTVDVANVVRVTPAGATRVTPAGATRIVAP